MNPPATSIRSGRIERGGNTAHTGDPSALWKVANGAQPDALAGDRVPYAGVAEDAELDGALPKVGGVEILAEARMTTQLRHARGQSGEEVEQPMHRNSGREGLAAAVVIDLTAGRGLQLLA